MSPSKQAATSKLADAERALATAQATLETARLASMDAAGDAAALRSSVKAGNSKVTPDDLKDADAVAVHAALAYDGASADIPALSAAVAEARVDAACDAVVAELPILGRDVAAALDLVAEALAPFVDAAKRYDVFVEESAWQLEKLSPPQEVASATGGAPTPPSRGGTASSPFVGAGSEPAAPIAQAVPSGGRPRFSVARYSHPTIDGVPLSSIRPLSQLARVLLPAMIELGAGSETVAGLKLMASGSPPIPGA